MSNKTMTHDPMSTNDAGLSTVQTLGAKVAAAGLTPQSVGDQAAAIAEAAAEANSLTTPAHLQVDRECVAFYYPEHLPRESDPHYKLFSKARKRIIAAGVGCWICGTKENLECHHAECEYAAATGVDVEKFATLFPEYHITSEEEFLNWVESEGNFQILCALHHRSPYAGVHHCPSPNWKLQRFWRTDLPAPVQAAPAAKEPAVKMPTGERP